MLQGEHSQYFRPPSIYQLLLRPLFCLFLRGRFTQVLLYQDRKLLLKHLVSHVYVQFLYFRCYFAKDYCRVADLHIYADSTCSDAGLTSPKPASTTPPPTTKPTGPTTTLAPLFLGHNAVQDFLCLELFKMTCQNDTPSVCATDGRTYQNM